jgi:predicted metal-binding membrane protein
VVKRNVVVAALGTTQTLAWGSSYYLPAILAEPIAQGLGLSRAMVFEVFSGSLQSEFNRRSHCFTSSNSRGF